MACIDDLALSSDDALVLAVAQGDRRAFRELMLRHVPGMVALAQRILGSHGDADDVVQEAFLRLWKHAPHWAPAGEAEIRTWLGRVVTNLCIDLWRKKPSLPLDHAMHIADPSKGAAERWQDSNRRHLLQRCLQRLPLRQRTAVVLSYYEGLAGIEIAKIMDLSPAAVESLLVRARRALRRDLVSLNIMAGSDL